MEETFPVKAIILKREPFRENDTRVSLYSLERGRIDAVARGTKKLKSKMAGHLEPITIVNAMVVKGRAFDYIGSASGEDFFSAIKSDIEKIKSAGEAFKNILNLVKEGEPDEKIFYLIDSFLKSLESGEGDYDFFGNIFLFLLLSKLGYEPELFKCIACGKGLTPGNNKFNISKGGLMCPVCGAGIVGNNNFPISDDSIKVLRLALKNGFEGLQKLKINDKIKLEIRSIIGSFHNYHHG